MFKSELPPSYEESQPQGGSSPPTPHTYTTPEMPGAEAGAEAEAGVSPPETSSGDIDDFDPSELWENKIIRHAFIRKVFLIVVLQLLVTTSIAAVFTFVDPLHLFVIQNPVVYGVSLYYETNLVVYYLVMMVVVCVTILVFSFQTKVRFPSFNGFFYVLGIVTFLTVTPTLIIFFHYPDKQYPILYSFFWVWFYTAAQAIKMHLLTFKRTYDQFQREYMFGALYFCTDIIIIFALLLQIILLSSQ
ncbi:protein lifeguard 3-like [Silurus asotus]|uniref:Protein lifeguard 3-like n=1 Tax=Silurus asotus TaxID=30991 RepID=A0AAD5FTM8_SILAS|nr:protein lifeguard 3-like [Silurus asotus]